MSEVRIILHDIRSAYNVGAVFRTADGAGATKVYLTGYTPAPEDRFGREQAEILKTSLGASQTVAWEVEAVIEPVISHLKAEGFAVVAIEQHSKAIFLKDFSVPEKVAYIMGNEITGVPEAICEAADQLVQLPMLGAKESLNVSVTAGIVLYHHLT